MGLLGTSAHGAGGAISLEFDTLSVNGQINVNGIKSKGAGGSILLEGNSLDGMGAITADGFGDNSPAGGGRVGLLVEDLTGFNGIVTAYGGFNSSTNESRNGGAGTVFYRNSTWPNGRLVIDNGDIVGLP